MKVMRLKKLSFYPKGYLLLNPDVAMENCSPIYHFLKYGLWEGRTNGYPMNDERSFSLKNNGKKTSCLSALFSKEFYFISNPDVRSAGMDPWKHFVEFGAKEGRQIFPFSNLVKFIEQLCKFTDEPTSKEDIILYLVSEIYRIEREEFKEFSSLIRSVHFFTKANIERKCAKKFQLIVTHELSRTGCPINALNLAVGIQKKYPVIFLAMDGGEIQPEVEKLCNFFIKLPPPVKCNGLFIAKLIGLIGHFIEIETGILNSLVSYRAGKACRDVKAHSLLFIHEFSYYLPKSYLNDFQSDTDLLVFSNETIKKSFDATVKLSRPVLLINQGKSETPESLVVREVGEGQVKKEPEHKVDIIFNELKDLKYKEGCKIILGVGSVGYRKGLDLFISVSEGIKVQMAEGKVKFVWLGEFEKAFEAQYTNYLKAQIQILGLKNHIIFPGSVQDVDRFYELADLFLMTSRLDPLPGCVIEALSHGVPSLIFDKASGFPDFYRKAELDFCICHYANTQEMVRKSLQLLQENKLRTNIIQRGAKLVDDTFSFEHYVAKVEKLIHKINAKSEITSFVANSLNKYINNGETMGGDDLEAKVVGEEYHRAVQEKSDTLG